jgi:transcriptional regulator with XRE-family HTH domain
MRQGKRLFMVSASTEPLDKKVVCVKKLNLTGRLVNKLRNERGWTQDELADRLQKAGWMISRSGVSKIESGFVYVHDFQIQVFAYVFRVPAIIFVPTLDMSKPIDETLSRFIYNEKRGLAPNYKTSLLANN